MKKFNLRFPTEYDYNTLFTNPVANHTVGCRLKKANVVKQR